ncbi:hypothetical protein LOK49_LG04G02711 [Camellia lanceoleosa]|uniref:Uncharacterized protein n=1 Tax=Camellia lanceoleosa TaxID=1840588 RepID=A0ACC0HZW6_9ERIC|nr:hypothetical protein LOK49_LG04G02711 [Camellia lanceoleosa]
MKLKIAIGVLVFFDDHQNELKQLKQALKAGFRHLVFEDNYDTVTGDHYSFRQTCAQYHSRGAYLPILSFVTAGPI